jgi:hypothetical protein
MQYLAILFDHTNSVWFAYFSPLMLVLGNYNLLQHPRNNTGLLVYYVFRSHTLNIKRLYFRNYNIVCHDAANSRSSQFCERDCTCGPGSSVSIATDYGMDGPGIESRWGRDFSHTSRPALGPTQPPVQWLPGLSQG